MNKKLTMIMAILMIILSLSTTVTSAATVQPKVQEKPAVETTAVPANTNDGKATKTYPKSMQMKIFESVIAGKEEGKKELARVQTQIVTLKENTVAIDEIGLAWKSGKGQDVVKVRVTSDKIQFEWTPIYRGYTWISDLSMWSDGKLPGREAKLEFLDKDRNVLWSANVTFKAAKKEEIVPPCPSNMAPQYTPAQGVEIGVAPGENK